jgi:hypothetical protein
VRWPRMATSVPVPMAMPRSAWTSAGASLTPSPTMATTLPSACRQADVGDQQVGVGGVGRGGRRRQPQQRPRRVLGVQPQVHLVRLARRHVGGCEPGVHRVAQVEEADPEGVGAGRAGVDLWAAAEVHHHQQLLLWPHAQLPRRLPLVGAGHELLAELPDHRGVGGVGRVEDRMPGWGAGRRRGWWPARTGRGGRAGPARQAVSWSLPLPATDDDWVRWQVCVFNSCCLLCQNRASGANQGKGGRP